MENEEGGSEGERLKQASEEQESEAGQHFLADRKLVQDIANMPSIEEMKEDVEGWTTADQLTYFEEKFHILHRAYNYALWGHYYKNSWFEHVKLYLAVKRMCHRLHSLLTLENRRPAQREPAAGKGTIYQTITNLWFIFVRFVTKATPEGQAAPAGGADLHEKKKDEPVADTPDDTPADEPARSQRDRGFDPHRLKEIKRTIVNLAEKKNKSFREAYRTLADADRRFLRDYFNVPRAGGWDQAINDPTLIDRWKKDRDVAGRE